MFRRFQLRRKVRFVLKRKEQHEKINVTFLRLSTKKIGMLGVFIV